MSALDFEVASEILRWLETTTHWELVETSFYKQYEFSLRDAEIPAHLSFLGDGSLASSIRDRMTSSFNTTFTNKVEIVAHKLVPGQRIGIHNDWLPSGETHRLIIHLNPGWESVHGGFFVLFVSTDDTDIHRIIAPLHNSAISFVISENSNHAISAVHLDARYSLVFSLWSMS